MREAMRWLQIILVVALALPTWVAAEQTNVELIIDASGSMAGQMEGRSKLEIAKEALLGLLADLPADARVAVRAYGHRTKDDCTDLELLAPLGPRDPARMEGKVRVLRAVGMTPIAGALEAAGKDFAGREGQRNMIILVSDGKETCKGDPCAVARRLRQAGVQVEINVIGFDVTPEERKQLECIAEGGGGKYYNAATAKEFRVAAAEVRQQVAARPEAPKKEPATKGELLFDTDAEGWERWNVRNLGTGVFRVLDKKALMVGHYAVGQRLFIKGMNAANFVMEGKFTLVETTSDHPVYGPRLFFRSTEKGGYTLELHQSGTVPLMARVQIAERALVPLKRGQTYSFRLEVEGTKMTFELGGKTFSYSLLHEFDHGGIGIGTYVATVSFESLKAWKLK